jgi:hypothetical protein
LNQHQISKCNFRTRFEDKNKILESLKAFWKSKKQNSIFLLKNHYVLKQIIVDAVVKKKKIVNVCQNFAFGEREMKKVWRNCFENYYLASS